MQTQAHPKIQHRTQSPTNPHNTHKHASQEPSIKGKKQETNQEQKIPDPSPKNGIDLKHAVEFSNFGSHPCGWRLDQLYPDSF